MTIANGPLVLEYAGRIMTILRSVVATCEWNRFSARLDLLDCFGRSFSTFFLENTKIFKEK